MNGSEAAAARHNTTRHDTRQTTHKPQSTMHSTQHHTTAGMYIYLCKLCISHVCMYVLMSSLLYVLCIRSVVLFKCFIPLLIPSELSCILVCLLTCIHRCIIVASDSIAYLSCLCAKHVQHSIFDIQYLIFVFDVWCAMFDVAFSSMLLLLSSDASFYVLFFFHSICIAALFFLLFFSFHLFFIFVACHCVPVMSTSSRVIASSSRSLISSQLQSHRLSRVESSRSRLERFTCHVMSCHRARIIQHFIT